MSEFLFVARFGYGKASLCKVKIIKETPKTYTVPWGHNEREELLGNRSSFPSKLLKSTPGYYKSAGDALSFLLVEARAWVTECQENLEKAEKEQSLLRGLAQGVARRQVTDEPNHSS